MFRIPNARQERSLNKMMPPYPQTIVALPTYSKRIFYRVGHSAVIKSSINS